MNYLNWWESRQRGQMMIRSCRLGTGRNSEMIHRSRLAAQLLMKRLLLIIHRWCRRGRNWRRSWTRRGPLILLMNGGRWRGRCRRSEIRIVGHIAALHPLLFIYPDVGGWLLLDDEKKRAERTNQIDERRRRPSLSGFFLPLFWWLIPRNESKQFDQVLPTLNPWIIYTERTLYTSNSQKVQPAAPLFPGKTLQCLFSSCRTTEETVHERPQRRN